MSNLVDKINTAGNVLNKDTRMKGRVLGGEPFEEGCKYTAHSVSNIDSHALYTHHIPRERIRASPQTVELRKQLAERMKGFRDVFSVLSWDSCW